MSQDSENWTLLQELFYLAEEISPEDRERVLRKHCPDEKLIRRALELVDTASALDGNTLPPHRSVGTGRVGPYTLIRLLGSGGIGSVYLAERIAGGAPQRVAMKMLAPHAVGPSFVERFHREQHILGSLDHPHITRMIDAGLSDSGQPYLAMEFVDGEHLDIYCDRRKLGITERLLLFLRVCNAVAYAHRSLIVHLDLKPSNILVTPDGTVKLLDFGTSKLIDNDNLLTTTVLATPAYASPEQLQNEAVTTSCDVYALGVILFELLSGQRPYAGSSFAVMLERAIKEQAPESLAGSISTEAAERRGVSESRLGQLLRGDLETIAGKCLQTRPKDRYDSVDLITQDIERHIEGLPVLARPQTAFYRIGKFVRRNRKLVTAAALSVIALAATLSYAEVKQRRAIEEGRRAEQMQNFMYTLLRLANSGVNGQHNPTVADFLHLGAQVLPQYIHDSADLRAAQMSMARSLAENDDLDDARSLYTQAEKSAKASGDIDAEADAEAHLGEIAYSKGDSEDGAKLTARALDLSRDSRVSPRVRADSDRFYAFYRDNLGFRSDENLRLLKEAVALKRQTQSVIELGETITMLGNDLLSRGQLDQAESYYFQAQQIYGDDPALLCERADVEGSLGWIIGKRGDVNKAVEFQRRGYEDMKQCSGATSHQTAWQATYLGDLLLKAGRNEEALALMEKTIPSERKIEPNSTDFSDSLRILGKACLKTGRLPQAEAAVKEAIAIRVGKTDPNHPVFGALYLLYAEILVAEHRDGEALPQAKAADRILKAAIANTPTLKEYFKDYSLESAQILANLHAREAANSSPHHS
jgi:serine/threonine protein kinase/tetratricopeptide (TPR) repeat protein